MVIVAALLCVPIYTVASKSQVAEAISAAICRIMGGDCKSSSEVVMDPYLPDCDVSSTAFSGEAEVTVFSVNVGGKVKMTLKEVHGQDGKTQWVVENAGGGHIGAHVMFGEKGKFGLGEGLSAEAKAAITAEGGASYTFGSREEAEEFMKYSAKEAGKTGAAASTGVFAPVTKWGLDRVDDAVGDDYNPPAASEYYVELGTDVSAEGTAAAGPEASVSAGQANALGLKVTPAKDGKPERRTVYYKGTSKLAAELGLGPLKTGPGGESEVVVALTFEDGTSGPVSAKIDMAGKFNDSVGGGGTGGGLGLSPNKQGKFSIEMDLTNEGNRDAVADVLNSTGLPIMPGSGRPGYQDPATAMGGLRDRFTQAGPQEGATFTAQTFEGASSELEVGFFAGDLITFGAGGKLAAETSQSTAASYYDPDQGGMVTWKRCGK